MASRAVDFYICMNALSEGRQAPDVRMMLMTGSMKAAVLPEPVWAHAMMSRPFSAIGMAYLCTGVGFLQVTYCGSALTGADQEESVCRCR